MAKIKGVEFTVDLPEGSHRVDVSAIRFSDNTRGYWLFKQLVRDGVPLHGELAIICDSPSFRVRIENTPRQQSFLLWLTPELEEFLFSYLLTGKNTGFPSHAKDSEPVIYPIESDYLYKHLKGEILRNAVTYNDEEVDGINGIRIKADYPFGSIDYEFFPHTWEELNIQLENIEPFIHNYPQYYIPELSNNTLPIEYRDLAEGKHLNSVLDSIPASTIIDKTICGCGATWLEINDLSRSSIIIEPNVPVIIGKEQQHKHLIGVYGKIKSEDIAKRIQEQKGSVKIMTTPDSYPKVAKALRSLKIDYLKEYFLLFDECEKIISDIDYRPNLDLPIDDFFNFQNKAMVSATPIVINDPRFEQYGFRILKIRPLFSYKRILELKFTNNVNVTVKREFNSIRTDSNICVFHNSVKGIDKLISSLKLEDEANIFCSTEAKKDLDKKDYPRVFDSITDKEGKSNLGKYNFFTSRFYSAVDIILDYKPVVMMISQAYQTVKDKAPYSLIDPETEAIQIAGRFRNGINRFIHITNTNPEIEFHTREELEQSLLEQHTGFHKLMDLLKSAATSGERKIYLQAIQRTDYWEQGFVNAKGEANYFRYNNAYLDERLKMLYRYSTLLHAAYQRSGTFKIISEAEFSIYTDKEKRKLTDGTKAQKIELLNNIIKRFENSENPYDQHLMEDLKQEFSLWVEAIKIIGFYKMKQLDFVDSAMKTEIKQTRFIREATNPSIVKEVYKVFKPNTTYPTSDVNKHLTRIFKTCNVEYDGRGIAKNIMIYFKAEEHRTTRERTWKLGNRLYNDL